MTWKEEIRKNVKFSDTAYTKEKREGKYPLRTDIIHRAEKEILEKLMEEVDKIPDGVLQFLYVQNYKIAKGRMESREGIEKSLKFKLRKILEKSAFEEYPELFQTLMKNELFASVLGDMKYDVEYTRDE